MKKWIWLAILLILYFAYGLRLSVFELNITPKELRTQIHSGFYDYSGVINVHSEISTGSGSVDEIVRAAQTANLDFLILNDLNTFNRPLDSERYYDELLFLIGAEFSYLDSRILLLDSLKRIDANGLGQVQMLLADLVSQKDRRKEPHLAIMAHPFKRGFHWGGTFPEGLDGIELLNLKTLWQKSWEASKFSVLRSLLLFPFNSELALVTMFRFPSDEMRLIDEIGRKRELLLFSGADATSRINLAGLVVKYPSYEKMFSITRNHVLLSSELTGNFQNDRRKIIEALKTGQFYTSLDILDDPKGFVTYIKDGSRRHFMGARVASSKNLELRVSLANRPVVPFEVVIYKDGEKWLTSNSTETTAPLHAPGVYRVLVRVKPKMPFPLRERWIPWIFANPFFIRA